jgi:hypothetical protein
MRSGAGGGFAGRAIFIVGAWRAQCLLTSALPTIQPQGATVPNGSAAPGRMIELRTYGLHRVLTDQRLGIVSDCFGEWARSSGRRPLAAVL